MPAALLIALINAAITLMEKIPQLIAIAKQRGELSKEQEADFERRMQAAFESPHWKSRRK